MRKLFWLFLFVPAMAFTQVSNPSIISVATAPTGSCSAGLPNRQVVSTGVQYSCQGGTWAAIGGSGSGTVSGQANGVIPLATGATAISAQSHIDDGLTTPGTITSTEPICVGTCPASGANLTSTGLAFPRPLLYRREGLIKTSHSLPLERARSTWLGRYPLVRFQSLCRSYAECADWTRRG